LCDALGNPIRFVLTAGQASDFTQAPVLMEGLPFEGLIADKGYDSNAIVEFIESRQALAVIPPKSNRKVQREYDSYLYKERNLVERLFNRLKQFRRVATRFEKRARNYLSMLHLAAITILLA
jgi:transposase